MKYCKDNKNFVILIKNLFDSIWLNILLNQLYFFYSAEGICIPLGRFLTYTLDTK